jgi:hypothetical protein
MRYCNPSLEATCLSIIIHENISFANKGTPSNVRDPSRSRSLSPIHDKIAFPDPLIGIESQNPDPKTADLAEKERTEIEKLLEDSILSEDSDNEVHLTYQTFGCLSKCYTFSDPKKGAFDFKNLKLIKYFSNLCKLN